MEEAFRFACGEVVLSSHGLRVRLNRPLDFLVVADHAANLGLATLIEESNQDGSIDVYFGPTVPKGKDANWVKTVEGGQWFVYFRLYGPTETYFDRSWPMYDIKEIK